NCDTFANEDWLTKVDFLQEGKAGDDTMKMSARHLLVIGVGQCIGEHAAGTNIDSVVVTQQVSEWHVLANGGVEFDLDAKGVEILITLLTCDLAGQAPDGDAANHHAAGGGVHIIDGDGIAHLGKFACARNAS